MTQTETLTSLSIRRSVARERLRYGFLNQATRQLDEVIALLEADESAACVDVVVHTLRRLAQTADALKMTAAAESAIEAAEAIDHGSRESTIFRDLRSVLRDAGAGGSFPPWVVCATDKLAQAFQKQASRCSECVELVSDVHALNRRLASGDVQGAALPVEMLDDLAPYAGQLILAYGPADDWEGRIRAANAEALYLARPRRLVEVLRPLRASIFDAVSSERILLLGRETEAIRPVFERMREAGYDPVGTRDRRRLLGLAKSGRPEVVILLDCPEVSELVKVFGSVPDGPAVMVTTSGGTDEDELYAAGAVDVLPHDVELETLEIRVHARLKQRRRRSWQRDRLTDVLTRPAILESLDSAVSRASRSGRPVSTALIEVVGLARTAAHRDAIVADQALRAVAQRIEQWVRREDVVGRVGRQTLMVGFVDCSAEDAARRVETLTEAWLRVARRQELWSGISLCCGVADSLDEEDMLRLADLRLAQALTQGPGSVVAIGGG